MSSTHAFFLRHNKGKYGGAKGGTSKNICILCYSGVMGHLVSASKKARGHMLGLCDAEKTKPCLL